MKRLISLAMMMLPVMAMAQIPQFAKLSEKYSNIEGITSMTINKQMIAMFAGDNDDFDFIDELQILLCEDNTTSATIVKDAKKAAKKSKIEELVSANEDGATFTIYTKTDDNVIKNIVIIVENESPSGFIVVSGDIPQEKLNEVVKIVNM